MDIIIRGTHEHKTLSIIDRRTGVDWTADLIGNADGLGKASHQFDAQDDGTYLASQDTYDWWAAYITGREQTDREAQELAAKLDMPLADIMDRIAEYAGDLDMDDERNAAVRALDSIRLEHGLPTTAQLAARALGSRGGRANTKAQNAARKQNAQHAGRPDRNGISIHADPGIDATNAYTVTVRTITGTKTFDAHTGPKGHGLWIDGKQVLGNAQFDAGTNPREAMRRYFKTTYNL